MYVRIHCSTKRTCIDHICSSNNSLRHSMTSLGLPSSTISTILDDPTILGARTSASDASFASLGVSPAVAERILGAYVQGFRTVFILNASLNAVATLATILLIRHTELTRGDEEDLRKKAIEEALQASEKNSIMEAKAESPSLPSAPIQNV